MTPALQSFHAYLQHALPLRSSELMAELQLQHRANPKGAAGLPTNAVQLGLALKALEREKAVERRDGEWHWKAETPKEERALFV